jgi:hypothetical protein
METLYQLVNPVDRDSVAELTTMPCKKYLSFVTMPTTHTRTHARTQTHTHTHTHTSLDPT